MDIYAYEGAYEMQLFITSGVQKPLFEFIVKNQKYFSFWFCYNLQLLSIARTVQSQKKLSLKTQY